MMGSRYYTHTRGGGGGSSAAGMMEALPTEANTALKHSLIECSLVYKSHGETLTASVFPEPVCEART